MPCSSEFPRGQQYLDVRRRHHREGSPPGDAAERLDPLSGPDRPEDNVVAGEQLRRLDAALGKISADKRVAFVLWAVDGKDVETISEMVGASVAATRSRIHYAQKELKALASTDPYLKDLVEEADDAG